MNRRRWEKACFWRAVEAADSQSEVMTAEEAVKATQKTRGELTTASVDTFRWQPEVWRFLERRTEWLEAKHGGRHAGGELARLRERLKLPRVPAAVVLGGAVAALAGGFLLTRLGNERELNLLALPLVGLLLWNAVVMIASLALDLSGRDGAGATGWLGGWMRRAKLMSENESALVARVDKEFQKLTQGVVEALAGHRLRRLLHVGAALVAAGSVAGLFAQGWSREYRVVWESTLLDEVGVTRFVGLLFAPASWVFGVEIPMEAVPAMRRGEGLLTQAAPALPWLQLYGGTLLLGVVLPRLLLAVASAVAEHAVLRRAMLDQGWGAHALRLLRRVEGGGQRLMMLAAGSGCDERTRQRWAGWVREMYGGRLELRCETVDEADQDRWAEAWQPEDGRVLVVFYLAATPEDEVQRAWLLRLRAQLRARHYEPEIVVLLDATGLTDKWSEEKRSGREALWIEALAGAADQTWKGDETGLWRLERVQKLL